MRPSVICRFVTKNVSIYYNLVLTVDAITDYKLRLKLLFLVYRTTDVAVGNLVCLQPPV